MEAFMGLFVVIVMPTLGVMILVWFRQVSKFFAYLQLKHPEEYKAMGEPSLFLNSTPKNNILFLRFIQGNRASELGDLHLAKWCKFLTRFFYVYLALFFSFILLISIGSHVV